MVAKYAGGADATLNTPKPGWMSSRGRDRRDTDLGCAYGANDFTAQELEA
jgi:hypothetical protein